jgi:hypothetical protein
MGWSFILDCRHRPVSPSNMAVLVGTILGRILLPCPRGIIILIHALFDGLGVALLFYVDTGHRISTSFKELLVSA